MWIDWECGDESMTLELVTYISAQPFHGGSLFNHKQQKSLQHVQY